MTGVRTIDPGEIEMKRAETTNTLILTKLARRIDTVKTNEAPGFVAGTLLIHRLLDAGTVIERRFHRWGGAGTTIATPTRLWNVETIAAVSTITAKDDRRRTEANPRTPAAMIRVRIVPRKHAARPINPTLAFADPPR